MQELISIPQTNLISAPGLSLEACATVEFLAIGAHAVRRAAISPGDTALVIGAGPIGLGVALFAKLAGAKVAVLDRDSLRTQVTSSIIGADSVLFDEFLDQSVAGQTGGDGFDVVFDATGNQASMQRGFDFVAAGGRYVLVSVVKEQITFSDPDFHRRELTLYGSRNATDEDFSHVITALRSGDVPLERIITHRTSLAETTHNLPKWAHDKSGLIKALIMID
jgi:2-desacetyl-2-hydroxyethyl bacteriochlorophyllide A dehydrogenase